MMTRSRTRSRGTQIVHTLVELVSLKFARRDATALLIATMAVCLASGHSYGQELQPRAAVIKPQHTVLLEHHRTDVIQAKFQDGLLIREERGRLTDRGTGALADARPVLDRFAAGRWQRMSPLPEERLNELRLNAQRNLGREIADLNLQFHLFLPPNKDAATAADLLNALDMVELAQPVLIEPMLPGIPDFEPQQGYLHDPRTGVGAYLGWNGLGTRGDGVRVSDIEGDFNANHLDLPPVTVVNNYDPQSLVYRNHGTAVLGQIGAIDNGWGVTGISPDAELHFAGFFIGGVLNVASAILSCVDVFDPGDIVLLEVQVPGPTGQPVPVEWWLPEYNAIQIAVGNDIIIVEAAGNGNQDLDNPIYSQGNNGHWPFLPENNSGAIIVGAGAAPAAFGGSDVPRSRLSFSNYGSRVDVQGWGERVATTGYGNAYNAQGENLFFTLSFSGTSSASPIVTGAAALLSAKHHDCRGEPIAPLVLREAMIETGSPQQSGSFPASQHIGPLPDVLAAAEWLGLYNIVGDLNDDCVVDGSDLLILLANWGDCANPDDCPADLNGDHTVDGSDLLILLANWG